jgi:hypothetical protein
MSTVLLYTEAKKLNHRLEKELRNDHPSGFERWEYRRRQRKGKASRGGGDDNKRGTDGEYSIQEMEEDRLAMIR